MFPPLWESLKLPDGGGTMNADGGKGSGRYPKGSDSANVNKNGVDAAFAKRYTDKVVGIKAASGVIIKTISSHALKRIKERDVSEDDLYGLIVNAPMQYPGNSPGTVCQQKDDLRAVINNKTGNIVSVISLKED